MKTKTDIKLPEGVTWEKVEALLKGDFYQKQLHKMSNETLKRIASNSALTLQLTKERISKDALENLTQEYITAITDLMQFTAQMILDERVKKKEGILDHKK